MIERLARLVSIPSVSGSEGAIADALSDELASLGFQVRRSGHNVYFQATDGPGPTLLFNSHLDTVPACAGWVRSPMPAVREGGRLYGLGANDAKGCVVALLEAALRVRKEQAADRDLPVQQTAGQPPRGQQPRAQQTAGQRAGFGKLWVAFTAAEEIGGDGLGTVLPLLPAIDAAVVGEPTSCRPVLAQKGLLVLHGLAHGVAGHAAHGELSGARNAVHIAARDIAALVVATGLGEAHPLLGPPTLQVTRVEGGGPRNVVPDHCEFWVDVRVNPGTDPQALAHDLARGLESELRIHSSRLVACETDGSEPVARAAAEAAGCAGEGSRTTSDWVHLRGIPTVKIGPGETARSHRADEYVTLDELERGATIYAELARRYFALARKEEPTCP